MAKHKCFRCGRIMSENDKDNPVTYGPDPFNSDINNDETEVWECRNCRIDSAGGI